MPLADSHIHLFRNGLKGRYGRSPTGGHDVEVYEALRSVHDIAAAMVVGYEDDGIDASNNEFIRSLAVSRDWISTVAYVRPSEVTDASCFEDLMASGHCGIALYLDADLARIVATWPQAVWRPLQEAQSILSLNVSRDALPAVATLARAHSECSFVISHLGDPGRYRYPPSAIEAVHLLAPLLDMAVLPNAYVKVSGLYAISDPGYDYPHSQATEFVDLVLGAFGPTRCMWGSDFSPSLDYVSFEQTANLPQLASLAEDELTLVMGGTLMALLELHRDDNT